MRNTLCLSGINLVNHGKGQGGLEEGDKKVIVDLLGKSGLGHQVVEL